MKANRLKHACKNVVGALALPVIMYVAMMIFCFANNKMYFGSLVMWRSLVGTIAASATCAYGIGLQFKSGRLDFSAGAVMLLSAIVAGNVAQICGNNPFVFAALCMILCVLLNIGVALVYVYGRLPIIIATLGMALLYESITAVVFDGRGVNLTANVALRQFSIFPNGLDPAGGLSADLRGFFLPFHHGAAGARCWPTISRPASISASMSGAIY